MRLLKEIVEYVRFLLKMSNPSKLNLSKKHGPIVSCFVISLKLSCICLQLLLVYLQRGNNKPRLCQRFVSQYWFVSINFTLHYINCILLIIELWHETTVSICFKVHYRSEVWIEADNKQSTKGKGIFTNWKKGIVERTDRREVHYWKGCVWGKRKQQQQKPG